MIHAVPFQPSLLLGNPHLQTILASFSYPGKSPPSQSEHIILEDGDILSCEVSSPLNWRASDRTIFLVHGLGGSHESSYMIRMTRKLYNLGYKIVRINLRGCGSGKGLSKKPFHSGKSDDVLHVLQSFKKNTPHSPFILVGFSVGGNIALKLAGELGAFAHDLLKTTIAVCPPVNLADSVSLLSLPAHRMYHQYYVRRLKEYGAHWLQDTSVSSIYEYDDQITAPTWGFKNASDFYEKCSSASFLSQIAHPCHILFAQDDPLVSPEPALSQTLPSCIDLWLSPKGGHMGFLGKWNQNFFWLDSLLLSWIESSFVCR